MSRLLALMSRTSIEASQVRSDASNLVQTVTRRSGCEYGNGASRTARTTENIAVAEPRPSASERTIATVTPG